MKKTAGIGACAAAVAALVAWQPGSAAQESGANAVGQRLLVDADQLGSYGTTGEGRTVPAAPIPNRYDQVGLLLDWVENGAAPGLSVTVAAGERSLPLCSYPAYPRYVGGAPGSASSYRCAP